MIIEVDREISNKLQRSLLWNHQGIEIHIHKTVMEDLYDEELKIPYIDQFQVGIFKPETNLKQNYLLTHSEIKDENDK